jgi:hypothetical protein
MDDASVDGLFFDGQHLSVDGFDFSSVHGFAACTSFGFWLSSWMIGSLDNAAWHGLLDGSFGDSETFLCSAALSHRFGGSLASCAAVLLAGVVLGAGVAPRSVPLVALAVVGRAGWALVVGYFGDMMWDGVLADGVPCYCGGQVAGDALCSPGDGRGSGAERGVVMAVAVAIVMAESTAATMVNATGMAAGVKVARAGRVAAAVVASATMRMVTIMAVAVAAAMAITAVSAGVAACAHSTITAATMVPAAQVAAASENTETALAYVVKNAMAVEQVAMAAAENATMAATGNATANHIVTGDTAVPTTSKAAVAATQKSKVEAATHTEHSIDSSADGSSDGSTEGSIGSSADGSSDSNVDGSTGGSAEGSSSGSIGDSIDSNVDGSTGGSIDGSSDGTTGDSIDSSADGSTGGSSDSSADGSTNGSGDSSANGSTDGSNDSSADGSTSDSIDGNAGDNSDSADGSSDDNTGGSSDSSADGSIDGSSDSSTDGSTGDSIDSNTGDSSHSADGRSDGSTGDCGFDQCGLVSSCSSSGGSDGSSHNSTGSHSDGSSQIASSSTRGEGISKSSGCNHWGVVSSNNSGDGSNGSSDSDSSADGSSCGFAHSQPSAGSTDTACDGGHTARKSIARVTKRAETVVTWKCGYAGVRVGEAAHPGPSTMQEQVQQLQAQLQQQQWDLTGQQANMHSLRAQLDSQQLQWYVEHSTNCRCSVCMMQLQFDKIIKNGSSARKVKDIKQQIIVLPTPRASGKEDHSGSDSNGSNSESASASDLNEGSSSGHNDSESDSNDSNNIDSDMLWTIFDQPRRKRGLRPSQRRVREREQIESQVKIKHNNGNRRNSDNRHKSNDDRYSSNNDGQSGSGYRNNNSDYRHNRNDYKYNSRLTTHQRSRRVPTVSQQMQSEMINTEKQLRDTADNLEEKQTVKALRRALNTVRVVANGLSQKQWQMRLHMHRGLRAGGLSDSGAVLRQWWRKGEQHIITVSQQSTETITNWAHSTTLHSAVKHWSLWRAAKVHKAVQYRVRSGTDPEAIRYSLPLHVDFLWRRVRHPNSQYHTIKTTSAAVLAWQLNAADMIQQHTQQRQAFSCLPYDQKTDPEVCDTYSCVKGCPFARSRQWHQLYNRYEPCKLIRYKLVEFLKPYKAYCVSVGRLAFNERHKAMVLRKLRDQLLLATKVPMFDVQGQQQMRQIVGLWNSQAIVASALGEIDMYSCDEMIDGDSGLRCKHGVAAPSVEVQGAVVDTANATRTCLANGNDSSSESDSPSTRHRPRIKSKFCGGRDDPNNFVRGVRAATANRDCNPNILLGELVVRMEDGYEVDAVLNWQATGEGPRGERLVPALATQQQTTKDPLRQIGDCKQGWESQLQAMFAAEFPVAHEQVEAEAQLAACQQTTTMGRHITTYNRRLASSRTCANSAAARIRLTNRTERKRFINSCIDELPKELKSVWSPKSYLLKNLYKLTNMQALQEEARTYCEGAVASAAFEAGLDDNY